MIQEELFELRLPYSESSAKTVRVFVPAHDDEELLPAVYMTDGQNLFEDGRPQQFGCWYTSEAVREEREQSGKAAIIVGIHNDEGPAQRARELTPKSIGAVRYPDDMPEAVRKSMTPEGESFDRFVIDTVIPEIEKRFPVRTGRENTAFCGSSSGGLQAFFTVLSHPDRFSFAGVFSPAFPIYASGDVIRWTKDHLPADAPYLYIYSGAGDPLERDICESTETVVEAFARAYPKDKLTKTIIPENRHHESAWAPIFKDFIHRFLNQ